MGLLDRWSLRGRYLRATAEAVGDRATREPPPLTPEALVGAPRAIRTYLQRVGAVGRPRVRSFSARFSARIRGGRDDPWMEGTAEQVELFHPPARHFFMDVRRGGVPVHVYHRYVGTEASMCGRVLGLLPLLDVRGPEMTRSETVTLLNDVALFAPAALLDLSIAWEEMDDGRLRATWENAGHTISALLRFDASGDLVDFVSEDRYRIEGKERRRERWSTPIERYATFDGRRVPARAEALWGDAGEAWSYIRFDLEEIRYNVGGGASEGGGGGTPRAAPR